MGRNRDRRRKRPHRPRASRAGPARAGGRACRGGPLSRLACYTWAAPTTLVGLVAGTLTLGTGGRVRRRRGALEFHGGICPLVRRPDRLRRNDAGACDTRSECPCLERLRDHEQAHVRQAERWGPAFIPAYLAASMLAWSRGGHYYLDNWFERDARRACGELD